MPLIEIKIDADVYDYLKSQVCGFRETESNVLRRLLNLPEQQTEESSKTTRAAIPTPQMSNGTSTTHVASNSPLASLLNNPSFRYLNATDKYLFILGFAHKQDPTGFQRVLQLGGRRRKYFGRSQQEIEQSGKSTHPREISGTGYWAMTNADTQQKAEILRKALGVLGYSDEDIRAAEESMN